MAGTSDSFFRRVQLTDVRLRVRDLATERAFYRDTLGFTVLAEDGVRCRLGVPASGETRDDVLLVLESAPDAPARPAGTAGLFHVAFLFPDRAALGRIARRLLLHGVRFGDGDHGVSEALYLDDPEGNGLELYADRPVAEWPRGATPDEVGMYTRAVDLEAVVLAGDRAPGPVVAPGTRVGHIHLGVSTLERAETFYGRALGFAVRQRNFPGALFLGRDGYHHHFGTNVWQTRRPAERGALGLAGFTVRFAEAREHEAVVAAVRAAGRPLEEDDRAWRTEDFDGIPVKLATG